MSVVSNSNFTKLHTERQVLTEILLHYKERPCLWNHHHEHYGQKSARDKYFMELLEKYQLIDENATIEHIKKKIDHMRCAYRRERICNMYTGSFGKHNLVLAAREKGLIHKPSLWYFDYLTFLNDDVDMNLSRDSMKHESSVVYLQENEEGDYEFEEVPKKRSRLEEILLSAPSSPPQDSDDAGNDNAEQVEPESSVAHQEAEAFGRTVGLQLKGLDSTQRFIAEKLISEVIFYARLEQLKTSSSIVTDTDGYK